MIQVSSRRLSAWLPVTLCTLLMPLCALVIRPWVEIGIIDDWSYIRTAQTLAKTGHIAYIGWSSAMLGWQLYVGALMLKLFSMSFTAPRIGTLLIATGVAALMHRLYVRLGLSEWNSAAATIIFLSSPPWMETTFSFMSDVYGMLVLVGCCYCCVRAVQTEGKNAAMLWVSAAALATGIGGTARQIAWLGVLVMVPCTLWLLRRNRRALWLGSACTALGTAIIPVSISWFNRQPYALPESVVPTKDFLLTFLLRTQIPYFVQQAGFELLFLSAPLLLCFLWIIPRSRRALLAVGLVLLYWAIRLPHLYRAHDLKLWAVPYMFNGVWFSGWEEFRAYLGHPALILTSPVRAVLTTLVLASELGLVGLLAMPRRTPAASSSTGNRHLSAWHTLILLGPCALAYIFLLVPRYLSSGLADRYMLFPEFVLLGAVVLLYQRNIRARLPSAVWVLAAVYTLVNTMGMHDTFNLFRAQVALLNRLQASGVPRTQLDGGAQFNAWTEVLQVGHLNDPLIQIPAGAYHPQPTVPSEDPCHTQTLEFTPSVHARYVVSFDPNTCGGRTGFEESFSTWLGHRVQTIYAVKGPE